MALNIKDPITEKLAAEVAGMAGESKTRAIRVALEQRRERLRHGAPHQDGARLSRFLEEEVWPQIPAHVLGNPLTREEREKLLGYGPQGV